MNVGPTGFADKFDSRLSKNEKSRLVLKFLAWESGRREFLSVDTGRTVEGEDLRRKMWSRVWGLLEL